MYLFYFYFLRARHDHNKIAPFGMIKVFLIELNSIETRESLEKMSKEHNLLFVVVVVVVVVVKNNKNNTNNHHK